MELSSSWLLKERVILDQPAKGYRAGLDAIILAASLRSSNSGERLLEAGCGAGAALICAALRLTENSFFGVERDPAMFDIAIRNIALNEMSARVGATLLDVGVRPDHLMNRYDHVFSNPPYFRPEAIQDVHPGRAGAYLADTPLEDWLKFMLHAVRPKGRVTLIHRAGELARILAFMDTRFGEIEVLPVRSLPGRPAKRVLVTARKGLRRGEITLHEGLTQYDAPEQLSARMSAIQTGAPLDWR